MSLLMEVGATAAGNQFPLAFTLVYVVGFIAAVSIGSFAWYNSKRPPGWENKGRPNFIPGLDEKEENQK